MISLGAGPLWKKNEMFDERLSDVLCQIKRRNLEHFRSVFFTGALCRSNKCLKNDKIIQTIRSRIQQLISSAYMYTSLMILSRGRKLLFNIIFVHFKWQTENKNFK